MPITARFAAAAARGYGLFKTMKAVVTDAYFNYVTLLLPGNGTNGAQNNTFLDSSSNAFTITRNGNTTQGNFSPFSQTGWGNYFNGSSDYLSVANNAALNLGTGDFTVECWVYPLAVNSGNANPVINKLNGATNTGWLLGMSSTSLWQFSTGASVIVRAGSVTLNQWTHLAAVRSSGTTTLYVNGTSVGTDSTSYNFTDAVSLLIGYNSSFVYCNCYVSNARVVKGTAVYTGNFTPSTTPLTAITNTQLLTCQSNRFLDNSANAFAITANGSPSVQAFSPFAPTAAWSASSNGGSGYFDGSGDYLVLPSSSNLAFGTGDFSVEGWIYLTSLGSNANIYSNATANDTEFAFTYLTTGVIRFSGWNTVFVASGSGAVTTNQWLHVVACRSGTTGSIFVNGSRVATATVTNNFSGTTAFGVGASGAGAGPITGYIGGFRVLKGSSAYDATQTTLTVPTAPFTAITNTQLLLSATNGAIVDATAKNDLETVGNAQISTTQSKFGGSSMYFDGTGDYLVSNAATPNLYAFGTGDFTIECWARFNSLPGNAMVYDGRPSGTSTTQPCIYVTSAGTLVYFANGGNAITSSAGAISTNTWYHIAVSRSGTSTKMFLGGTQAGSTYTDSTSYTNTAQRPVIGVDGALLNSGYLDGYIDDLRVTKGVARYTANFTPPTTAFPLQ